MQITKLKLEDLAVQSFSTGPVPNTGGTVRAHQHAFTEAVDGMAASDYPTCKWTCDDPTCGVACPTGPNDPACKPEEEP